MTDEPQFTDEQYEAAKAALYRRWPVTTPEAEEALTVASVRALSRVIEESLRISQRTWRTRLTP